jgi:hypothetical protein
MKNYTDIEWIINRRLEDARKKIIKDINPKGPKKLKGSCFFPIEWSKIGKTEKGTDGFSGPAVNDPYLLTAYYYDSTSLSDPDYYLEVDLRKAVKGMIEGHELGKNGLIDEGSKPIFKSVSAALRHLADKLDNALERK